MTRFLLTGDHLAPETPSPLPHGDEDVGEAFDFEDTEEEEEEEDSAADPSSEVVLRAPPRRRRATSSGGGEEHRLGGSSVSPPCPLWMPRVALVQACVPTPFLFPFPLCRWAGAGDPGRVCEVWGEKDANLAGRRACSMYGVQEEGQDITKDGGTLSLCSPMLMHPPALQQMTLKKLFWGLASFPCGMFGST